MGGCRVSRVQGEEKEKEKEKRFKSPVWSISTKETSGASILLSLSEAILTIAGAMVILKSWHGRQCALWGWAADPQEAIAVAQPTSWRPHDRPVTIWCPPLAPGHCIQGIRLLRMALSSFVSLPQLWRPCTAHSPFRRRTFHFTLQSTT